MVWSDAARADWEDDFSVVTAQWLDPDELLKQLVDLAPNGALPMQRRRIHDYGPCMVLNSDFENIWVASTFGHYSCWVQQAEDTGAEPTVRLLSWQKPCEEIGPDPAPQSIPKILDFPSDLIHLVQRLAFCDETGVLGAVYRSTAEASLQVEFFQY